MNENVKNFIGFVVIYGIPAWTIVKKVDRKIKKAIQIGLGTKGY